MRIRNLVLAALISCAVSLHAETLREFLGEHGIPTASVPASALTQTILPGLTAQSADWLVAAWSLPGSSAGTWPLHLIGMNRQTRITTIGELQLRSDDACAGALWDMDIISGFVILETNISPSANCLLVVDRSLHVRHTLYGFDPHEVRPGSIVLIEDMVHFAPVHPERLQWADLATGRISELYPSKGDPLRAQFARRNAANMPPAEVCARMNDPCNPDLFDETITGIATDERGRFAMVVQQEDTHALASSGPAKTFAAQSVVYLYRLNHSEWTWCESPLKPEEATRFSSSEQNFSIDELWGRCQPDRPVIPDMTSAQMNPFISQR